VWHRQLAGALLPSLRRFTATLSSRIANPGAYLVALSAYRLYLADADGRLWAARIPR